MIPALVDLVRLDQYNEHTEEEHKAKAKHETYNERNHV